MLFSKQKIKKNIQLSLLFLFNFNEVFAGKVILIRVHNVQRTPTLNRRERSNTFPLHQSRLTIVEACVFGDTAFVRRYLSNGGSPNTHDQFQINSLLGLAVQHGHNEIVQALLDAGALVHRKDSGLKTYDYQLPMIPLLFKTAERGNLIQCKMLLAAGADIDGKKGCSDQCKPLWGALNR